MYLARLEVMSLIHASIYIPTLCMLAVNALAGLRICATSCEPSMVDHAIRIHISCAGSFIAKLYRGSYMSAPLVADIEEPTLVLMF